jgi:hypothetical protein
VIASVDFEDGVYRVYAVNDGDEQKINLCVKILSSDRSSVREYCLIDHIISKYSSDILLEAEGILENNEVLICDIEGSFGRDRAFYQFGGLEIEPVKIDFNIYAENCKITVSANDKYVHAVTISGNVVLDDNCFSLLPYESRTVSYRPSADGLPIDLSVEAYTLV